MAKLIVNPTSSSRREIPLPRTLLSIGRDPSNDLVLPDAMVSRRHAVLEYRGNQYYIRDCNSSNGSLVNGDRVSERSLRDGDLVAIGTARLLFREDLEIEDAGAKVVQHPSSKQLQCPTCHADYRKSDLFCKQCGTQLAASLPARAVCTSCGTAVPLPAMFCNACGHPLVQQDGERETSDLIQATRLPGPAAARPASVSAPAPPPHAPVETEPAPIPDFASQPAAAAPPVAASPASSASPERTRAVDVRPPVRPPAATAPVAPPVAAAGGRAASPGSRPPMAASTYAPPSAPKRPRPATPHSIADASVRREATASAPATPAGFGPRLAAGLIDGAILALGWAVLVSPAVLYWWSRQQPSSPADVEFLPILLTLVLALLAAILSAVYCVYFWGVRGATPGKQLLGLAVEGEDGTFPIGVAQAAIRLFGYLLSGAVVGIGFLMIAFGGSGLHDRIAGTRVVRRERV